MSVFYLSFAAESFLGACVIEADDFLGAVARTHALGINPGGQVLGAKLPPGVAEHEMQRDRLYSADELREWGMRSIREWDEEPPR